jgi:SAM-dependent methyltransferase
MPGSSPWTSGDAYETLMGRWSELVAGQFVKSLEVPDDRAWLDVGCGTGALTRAVLAFAAPTAVTGVDRSEEYVAFARARTRDARARFQVGDAQQLEFAAGSFGAVVSGLALNFVPDPGRMVAEMRRVAGSRGVVGLYVWDYAEGMEMLSKFWEAAVALDPPASARDERRIFPVCRPPELEQLFIDAGLGTVAVHPIDVRLEFSSFDEYWRPFLSGQGPSGSYAMSLDAGRREALRARLQASIPAGGPFSLVARAWAVRGNRP